MSPRLAIVGCGNPNRRDDGAGPEVLRLLRATAAGGADERVRLLDAGTDGMAVMFAARGCDSLIIVDACRSGSQVGAIFEVPGGELEKTPPASFNLHDFRWDHALHAGRQIYRQDFPSDVTVFLIEAETVAFGVGLSKPVAKAVIEVADRIRARIPAPALSGEAPS